MNLLSKKDIKNYSNYKYLSIDNTFLTYYYNILWYKIQKQIPKKLHPNIITLLGLFSVIFTYWINYLLDYSYTGNILVGIGIFLYMNFDGLDGIHARNTKQTSIIGEYFDHLIDLIVNGFIIEYLCNMLGFNNNIILKNIIQTNASVLFIKSHFEAIINKKMIFEGITDVTLLLNITIVIILLNLKFLDFIIKNNFIVIILLLILFAITLKNIFKFSNDDNIFKIKIFIISYYSIKLFLSILRPIESSWIIQFIDLPFLLNLINLKVFNKDLFYTSYISLVLFIYSKFIAILFVVLNIIFFIYCISQQLNIKLFYNY